MIKPKLNSIWKNKDGNKVSVVLVANEHIQKYGTHAIIVYSDMAGLICAQRLDNFLLKFTEVANAYIEKA